MAHRRRHDRAHRVPPMELNVQPLAGRKLLYMPVRGYSVMEWHPDAEAKEPAEAIAIEFELGDAPDGEPPIVFALRITSRPEANRLIEILERHRDSVWPLEDA